MLYIENKFTGVLFTVKEFARLRKQIPLKAEDWKYIDIGRKYTYKNDGTRYAYINTDKYITTLRGE